MKDKTQKITRQHRNTRSIETPLGNIEIDYDLLGKELESSNLSEDEKKEFIDCICWIMLSFVDLGFGIEPAQLALLAGQSESDHKPPPTIPFVDMIMASDLSDKFKSSTDTKHSTNKKETTRKETQS